MRNTKDGGTDEKIVWGLLRALFLVIGVLFVLHGIFWDKSCNGIDNEFLNCVLTGSIGDILGTILFSGGMIWMSNILKGFSRMGESITGSGANLVAFVAMIVGFILFWFL